MARIRTIKPEFWLDEDLASVSPEARLLAIGLLNHADDEGFFRGNPMLIRAAVFPLSESALDVPGLLNELSKIRYITLHEGSNKKVYGLIHGFTSHQVISRPTASKIKGLLTLTEDSMISPGTLSADSIGKGKERKGKEGNGKEGKKRTNKFVPPTLNEILVYCQERKNNLDPQKFYDFFTEGNWIDSHGNSVKNWKQKIISWEKRNGSHQSATRRSEETVSAASAAADAAFGADPREGSVIEGRFEKIG